MSQIKLKRLSFRVRWENVAKGGLAKCLKELLRKQTQLPDRQTDPETERLTDAKTDRRIGEKDAVEGSTDEAAGRITYTQRAMTTTKKLPTRCY